MSREQRAIIVRWVTVALTVAAFAASYNHGVTWAMAHTHHGSRGFWVWLTAALPEVMVGLSVLVAMDEPRSVRVWVIGSVAVGWTLWANGSAAGPGVSGLVVALWPALAALSALWLMGHGSGHRATMVAQTEPRVMPRAKRIRATGSSRTNVDGSFKPSHGPLELVANVAPEPPSDDSGAGHDGSANTALERGVRWAVAQSVLPSRAEIVDEIGCSTKTASRIRTAASAARAAGIENDE